MRHELKFILLATTKKSLLSFFTWWKVLLFISISSLILLTLFPHQLLVKVLKNDQPSEVVLNYLQAFRNKDPHNIPVILALIEQEIGLGQLKEAKKNIAYLKTIENPLSTEHENQLIWCDYLMIRYQTDRAKLNTEKHISYLRQLRQLATSLANAPLRPQQLAMIAKDNLGVGQAKIALKIYNDLMSKNLLETPEEFAQGGNIAMQNNAHLDSAKFYWAAYNKAKTLNEKKQYALNTIEVLWAGNYVDQALLTAKQLPNALIRDRLTLLYLSRLALAANRPAIAKGYVLRALQQPNTIHLTQLKKIPYDNDAFTLLFHILTYESSIKAAYNIALIAVANRPNDLAWHSNLAQTATWVGNYNLGIQEWLYVVKHEKNKAPMKHAIKITKLLGYDPIVVEMLKNYLTKQPNDTGAQLQLAEAENRTGNPKQALFTLKTLMMKHPTQAAEKLKATIYKDTGQWDKAIKSWEEINKHYGYNTKNVMAEAEMYYIGGQFKSALNVLVKAIPTAKKNDKDYWETLANLAWMLNDRRLAILGYSQDLNDSSHLLRLVDLERISNQQQALSYSLRGWSLFHSPLFFFDAIYLIEQLYQWPSMSHLLLQLTKNELKMAEQTQIFWQAQARLYAAFGLESLQKTVLATGILRHPELQQLKSDFLWLIIGTGDLKNIKWLMNAWYEQGLINDPAVWHVFAEGFAVFNQCYQAISIYQHHLIQNMGNDQVMIDYANLLEKTNRKEQAYYIRQLLWKRVLLKLSHESSLDKETLQSLSKLAPYFVSGTEQIQLINALVDDPRDVENFNILLNWLVQNNFFSLLSLLKAQNMNVPLPDRIEIYLALIRNDLQTLQNILNHRNREWPRADRINAAVRLENTPLAENLAFSELSERPLATEVYTEFVLYALADANAITIAQENEQFIDLNGPRTKLDAKLRLTNTWKMRPYFSIWDVRSTSPSIVNVPAADLQAGIKFEEKIHRGNITYTLGYRHALSGFTPISAVLNYQLAARWLVNLDLGVNQEISQTPSLRIGGVQDQINANFIYNLAKYDSLQAGIQGYNYYSQDRFYLSDGYYLHGLYEHKLYLTYPDFTVGLFGDTYQFNRNGSFGGNITTLFPPLTPQQQANPALVANTDNANYQQIVPPSYSEGGFIFSFGNAILDYTHTLRPYLWTRIFYNTYVGFSYEAKVGANMSVFGRDSLLFYFERGTGEAVINAVTQKYGLRYAVYF